MKIQLALLLVVLFVSLPSVVFSQPPLSAVQSGETSQTAPTAETVEKSWKGPFFGLRFGLGATRGTVNLLGLNLDTPLGGALLGTRVRLGYGFSDRFVLYYGFGVERLFGLIEELREETWGGHFVLGMMLRGARVSKDYYGFFALGSAPMLGDVGFAVIGGSGYEVNPSVSLEITGIVKHLPNAGVSFTSTSVDISVNFQFY